MKRHFASVTILLAIAASAGGQEAPKPAPELRRLDYFVGTWAAEGEIKPGPMGSGGKFTGTNRVQWMDGGFFLVTQSEFAGAMGKGAETAYMGYDGDAKAYTYDSFNTLGEAVILVRHFVLPRPESATTVNAARGESRLNAAKCAIAVQRWYRIAVFQPGVPHVVNIGLRADERCREQTADHIGHHPAAVDRLVFGFGDFRHQ